MWILMMNPAEMETGTTIDESLGTSMLSHVRIMSMQMFQGFAHETIYFLTHNKLPTK